MPPAAVTGAAGFPFTSGYEEWCDLDGTGKNLVCVRKGEQGS